MSRVPIYQLKHTAIRSTTPPRHMLHRTAIRLTALAHHHLFHRIVIIIRSTTPAHYLSTTRTIRVGA